MLIIFIFILKFFVVVVVEYISETMRLGAALPPYRTFALEELQEATNNFDTSTFMGESSNGQVRTL